MKNFFGGPSRTVTALSVMSRPHAYEKLFWWAFTDSNRGPIGYEPTALTNWAKGPQNKRLIRRTMLTYNNIRVKFCQVFFWRILLYFKNFQALLKRRRRIRLNFSNPRRRGNASLWKVRPSRSNYCPSPRVWNILRSKQLYFCNPKRLFYRRT